MSDARKKCRIATINRGEFAGYLDVEFDNCEDAIKYIIENRSLRVKYKEVWLIEIIEGEEE